MSAKDHLSKQLFHGTSHFFQEGETLNTSQEHFISNELGIPGPRAFATNDIDEARYYAGEKAAEKGMLFGPVYEVHSQDAVPMTDFIKESSKTNPRAKKNEQSWSKAYRDVYTSTQPMKPGRIVSWGRNPEA